MASATKRSGTPLQCDPVGRHGRLFVIGADASGRMLELVARTSEAGEVVVFHAMPLRTVNAKRYLP